MFNIEIYSILIWLSALIMGSLGIVVFAGSKKLSSRLFVLFAFSVFFWMVPSGVFISVTDILVAEFFVRFLYFLGILIAAAFLYFTLSYPYDERPPQWIGRTLIAVILLFIPLYYFGLLSRDAQYIGGIERWGWGFGPLWFLFDLFFEGAFIGGLVVLYRKYRAAEPSSREKIHLRLMFWTIVIGVTPPYITSILLPRLGYFALNWLGSVTQLVWISFMGYSIAKYQQMNVKALATEVFILVMTGVLFANIFIGETLGLIGRILAFAVFLFVGYFFIRGILREAEQKEQLTLLTAKLKDLNEHLEEKVEEQAGEIKRAYEVEKTARIGLEKLNQEKDRFLLATQHNLRTPLTVVKGFLDAALQEEKDKGPRDYLQKATKAADEMTGLLNNVLEVAESRIDKKES